MPGPVMVASDKSGTAAPPRRSVWPGVSVSETRAADADADPRRGLRVVWAWQQAVRLGILRIKMHRPGIAGVYQKAARRMAVNGGQNGRHPIFQLQRQQESPCRRLWLRRGGLGQRQSLVRIVYVHHKARE